MCLKSVGIHLYSIFENLLYALTNWNQPIAPRIICNKYKYKPVYILSKTYHLGKKIHITHEIKCVVYERTFITSSPSTVYI